MGKAYICIKNGKIILRNKNFRDTGISVSLYYLLRQFAFLGWSRIRFNCVVQRCYLQRKRNRNSIRVGMLPEGEQKSFIAH